LPSQWVTVPVDGSTDNLVTIQNPATGLYLSASGPAQDGANIVGDDQPTQWQLKAVAGASSTYQYVVFILLHPLLLVDTI